MKLTKRIFSAILFALCLSVLPASVPFANMVYVEAAVKINKSKVTIYVGNTYILKISGTSAKTKWTTSDKSVATVSSKGKVTGKKKGTATITATVGSKKYTCKVTVKNPSISEDKLDMEIADTAKLSIKGAKGDIAWESSDKDIVSVSKNGFVYAKHVGTAKIKGTYQGKTYTCDVKVSDKKLHASATKLTISRDTEIAITVDEIQEGEVASYDIADTDIVACYWGDWNGNAIPLKIKPQKLGSTSITVTADGTNEKLVIDVTVVDKVRPKTKKLSAEEVYELCSSSSVQINTDKTIGSGFFIDRGKVVTNYHVIDGASEIKVQLQNGKTYHVEYILGYSKELDIAILSIPVETSFLPICQNEIKVGETVYAIGSPLGFSDTFTDGIISSISRRSDNVEYIQTNAAITHGNSGGPLINAYGEVVGINTISITEGQNLNFAININELYRVSIANPLTVAEFYEINSNILDSVDDLILEDEALSGNINTAQNIPAGIIVMGSISSLGKDYYRFTLNKDNSIVVSGASLYGNEDTEDLVFEIFDSNGNAVTTIPMPSYTQEGDLVNTIMSYLPAGTYYVGVSTTNYAIISPIPYVIIAIYE